jgi:hypothetical protein
MLVDHAPWGGPPLHTYRDGDEWFYVTKVEFVYEVGGKRIAWSKAAAW